MANFIFKLVLLGFVVWVVYMIATGNMGEAKDATANYNKILSGAPAAQQK